MAYGGLDGLRDEGLLEFAISLKEANYQETHLHENIFEMTAAYGFHLVKKHSFQMKIGELL